METDRYPLSNILITQQYVHLPKSLQIFFVTAHTILGCSIIIIRVFTLYICWWFRVISSFFLGGGGGGVQSSQL